MSANVRETRLCIGFHRQSALQTALAAADCISFLKTNPAPFVVDLKTESDAAWVGKSDEFPTKNYLTNWDVSGAIEGFLSSEKAALVAAFGLGSAVLTPITGGAFQYACSPLDPVAAGIELPSTTVVEAIRQGDSAVIDRALVGMCCEEFGFEFNSGPGLQNARLTSHWVGCGKVISPSGILLPALTDEHLLPGYSMSASILGTDYIAAKTIQSATFNWKNNIRLDSGFYPGSGSQNGGQIRGRMEHGDRTCAFGFVARFASGSTELAKLLAQTEGTAVLQVTGADIIPGSPSVPHGLKITLQRVVIQAAVIGDANGIVTVAVTCLPMTHIANGFCTIEVTTTIDDLLETS